MDVSLALVRYQVYDESYEKGHEIREGQNKLSGDYCV